MKQAAVAVIAAVIIVTNNLLTENEDQLRITICRQFY